MCQHRGCSRAVVPDTWPLFPALPALHKVSMPPPRPRPNPVPTATPPPDGPWAIPAELHRRPLDGVVRALLSVPWSEARRLVETGKIKVAGEVVTDTTRAVRGG